MDGCSMMLISVYVSGVCIWSKFKNLTSYKQGLTTAEPGRATAPYSVISPVKGVMQKSHAEISLNESQIVNISRILFHSALI